MIGLCYLTESVTEESNDKYSISMARVRDRISFIRAAMS